VTAKYHEYIRYAVDRGCWFDFDTGEFVSHTGLRKIPKLYGKQRYPSTAIMRKQHFPIHKFVAYLLYGEISFAADVEVRHLDGNTLNLSKENIVLGTSADNQMDKSSDARSAAARKARAAQSRPTNSVLTEDQVKEIKLWYKLLKHKYPKKLPNGSLKNKAKEFGVTVHCIGGIVNEIIWKDVNV